jgi:hypothetical protein
MTTAQYIDQSFTWIAQHRGPIVDWADTNGAHRYRVVGARCGQAT